MEFQGQIPFIRLGSPEVDIFLWRTHFSPAYCRGFGVESDFFRISELTGLIVGFTGELPKI